MDHNRTIITQSPQETQKVGEELAASIVSQEVEQGEIPPSRDHVPPGGRRSKAIVICLYGELGSGKTTFVQGLARGLGITTRLLSPTFIIVRRYELPSLRKLFYHIDLYRMESGKNLAALGLSEIFADGKAIVAIEWPERLGELLPKERLVIQFQALDNGQHKILFV